VNVALPSSGGLGFTETSLVWVVNAYMLTFGGFLLLSGGWATCSGTAGYFSRYHAIHVGFGRVRAGELARVC